VRTKQSGASFDVDVGRGSVERALLPAVPLTFSPAQRGSPKGAVRTKEKKRRKEKGRVSPAVVMRGMTIIFVAQRLDPAEDQQDYDHENDESQPAGGVVTPFSTVRPTWKSAYQSQNQDHNQEHNQDSS
jgi:hypothetical protein